MRYRSSKFFAILLLVSNFNILPGIGQNLAYAASLQLTWTDNSDNEDGFNIERRLEPGRTFAVVGSVGANVTSYTDTNLADSTTYCYRVNAFNTAGPSLYSGEACGTTPTPSTGSQTFILTVSAQGSGTITSNPAGIACGSTCSASFTSGAVVLLQATPDNGYSFSSWSGAADCSSGSVMMNGNKSCTATFAANSGGNPTLTVNAVGEMVSGGIGSGMVVSVPRGINCGSNCSAVFKSGTKVTLQARPARGSVFAGWSGDPDCASGFVIINGNTTCSGMFQPLTSTLSVTLAGSGTGTVITDPSGIDCGSNCTAAFARNAVVTLTATADPGSVFTGWHGARNCATSTVRMNRSESCVAIFTQKATSSLGRLRPNKDASLLTHKAISSIGLYRPSTGYWYLIANGAGVWHGCDVDICLGPFGQLTDLAIVGDWNGSGTTSIGIYDSEQQMWEIDANGNGTWQGCAMDTCLHFAPPQGSGIALPVIGDWDGSGKSVVGLFQLAPSASEAGGDNGYWYFDRNANGTWDGCKTDLCLGPFGAAGDLPVVGDWDGSGVSKIGVFEPETGIWRLDFNGNGKWDGCEKDRCLGPFGYDGDIPVVGDWDGSGTSKIGVFRPSTGEWFFDLNGNGQWDGCDVDRCITGFGQDGDLPVVGNW